MGYAFRQYWLLSSLSLLTLLCRTIILIQMVLLNVMNDRNGNEVAHTHLTPQEKPDLCAANIILNELLDDMDVIFPGLQTGKGFIDICATALNNEGLGNVLADGLSDV
jgi:hypothetical protein